MGADASGPIKTTLAGAVELAANGYVVGFAPQPGPQTAFLSCPIGDILFGGARGGGKTYALLGDFLAHALAYGKGAKGIFFRRTYDELDEVKAQAEEIFPLVGAVYKTGKSTWYFPNGATLKLRYLRADKDADRYQGHQYTWMAVDEAGNFPKPDPIDKLRATLRSKAGTPTFLRLSANPGGPGHGWIKARYIDPAPPMTPFRDETDGTLRVFIPSKLEDNLILTQNDPTYRDRIRASGPAWLVQAWLLGDWNATPDGGIVKAEWFRRYNRRALPEFSMVVQSWDTAYKDKQINDPSCCTTWGVARNGFYLLDVFVARMDYPAVRRAVASQAKKWAPNVILIEDKASGQSLIQEFRADGMLPVVAINPEADKVTRLSTVSPLFESGRVFLPEAAAWLLDYEIELTIFPLAAHDDRVDSTSQFLKYIHNHAAVLFEAWGTGNEWAGHSGFSGADGDDGSQLDPDSGFGRVRSSTNTSGF